MFVIYAIFNFNSDLEKHRSKFHPSSDLEVSKVVLFQKDFEDLSEEEDDRNICLYVQHKSKLWLFIQE